MIKEIMPRRMELDPEAFKQGCVEFLKSLFPDKYGDLDTSLPGEVLEKKVREEQRRGWEHLQKRNPI